MGRAYLDAHTPSDFVASTTGGSVARGEADEYSDLDLTIYVDALQDDYSANCEFDGEILQLHVQPFPSTSAVFQSPWGFRFLREARLVSDPTGRYERFAREALTWLNSGSGRTATQAGALSDVAQRRSWADRTIREEDHLGTGMASMAAVTDAALLYRFTTTGSVSTGAPVMSVCEAGALPAVDVPWRHIGFEDADILVKGLAAYRSHLAQDSDGGQDFVLDEIQDRMTARKAARLIRQGDPIRLGEMLYHETFWTLITRGSRHLAEHLAGLPRQMLAVLQRIGFDEPDPHTVRQRLTWADEVCQAACSEP